MYKERPNIVPPEGNPVVWRYIDFTKFLHILETRTLYFGRLDLFEDKHEGALPTADIDSMADMMSSDNFSKHQATTLYKAMASAQVRHCYINCWHISAFESIAMWKLYTKGNEGIAIKSTVDGLKGCFEPHTEDDISIGVVNYIDYDRDRLENKLWHNVMHKRKAFEYEKEVRCFIYKPGVWSSAVDLFKEPERVGIAVKIDVPKLVEEIVISPYADKTFVDLVGAVLKRYNTNLKCVQSKLLDDPK